MPKAKKCIQFEANLMSIFVQKHVNHSSMKPEGILEDMSSLEAIKEFINKEYLNIYHSFTS